MANIVYKNSLGSGKLPEKVNLEYKCSSNSTLDFTHTYPRDAAVTIYTGETKDAPFQVQRASLPDVFTLASTDSKRVSFEKNLLSDLSNQRAEASSSSDGETGAQDSAIDSLRSYHPITNSLEEVAANVTQCSGESAITISGQ